MRVVGGRVLGQISVHADGPWPCEFCGQLSQMAEVTQNMTRVFCVNERCGFRRIIDKKNRRIVEGDGSIWSYDPYTSKKVRIG